MKTSFLTRLMAVAVAMLTLSVITHAQDIDACSNATLSGDYAFTVNGQILNPDGTTTTRDGVALAHFDGAGNLTQVDFVMSLTPGSANVGGINTNPEFRTGETGTYSVNSNCTGSAEIDFPPPPHASSGAIIKLVFVLSDHGRAIHTVVSSLTPPAAPGPVPALIHSEGRKL